MPSDDGAVALISGRSMQMGFAMLISEAIWLAFAAFSGLRIFSYIPQIRQIARDRNGASAISYPTWLVWTGANASTAMYAANNLNDIWLALVSAIYGMCCVTVIGLTMFKRIAQRRDNLDENGAAIRMRKGRSNGQGR